ncbi:unnamed protein product [Brassicogethes aeneus]|uniref:Lipase n=1 Tax=Brassicogethes aeneus TaxID=1431903 RepID=A0A9P0AVB9_BRAAE|nr:unnamed protein product [Brassicogethes aeneus]
MRFVIIGIQLFTSFLLFQCLISEYRKEDFQLPLKYFVNKNGYPLEEYSMVTDDGYILTTHRVPHGKNSTKANPRPILINHGMGGGSENFFALGPKESLAYLLADIGYDVWMMNARGSFYSRKHVTLDPDKDVDFWKFSFHEIGTLDTAANIDFILNKTGKEDVFYIGHSQGSTAYFVLTAMRPEYNKRIKMHVSFGPPVFIHLNPNDIQHFLSLNEGGIKRIFEIMNHYEMTSPKVQSWVKRYCVMPLFAKACGVFMSFVAGGTPNGTFREEMLPWFLRTSPVGTSLYGVGHYLQEDRSGLFRQFDFGPKENLKRYNATLPPEYNLNYSTAPAYLIYSENDWFASKRSVDYLTKKLPNVVDKYKIPKKVFNHLDYLTAPDVRQLVYEPTIQFLKEYFNIT